MYILTSCSIDEIWVEHRRPEGSSALVEKKDQKQTYALFSDNLRRLLFESDHYDVKFIVGPDKTPLSGSARIPF